MSILLEKEKTETKFQIGDKVKLADDAAWANQEGIITGISTSYGRKRPIVEIPYIRKDGEQKTYPVVSRFDRLTKLQ